MVGHLLGAAGAVEFITCVKELQEGFIHATVGYQIPVSYTHLDVYKRQAVPGGGHYGDLTSRTGGLYNSSDAFGPSNEKILFRRLPAL